LVNEYVIAINWRLQRLIEQALVTYDPLKIADRQAAKEKYKSTVKPIAARLARIQRKPKPEQTAFIIWGTLHDLFGASPVYEEVAYLPLGEMINRGWDDCFI